MFPSMPLSAITKDHIDHVTGPYAIADVISRFVSTGRRPPEPAWSDQAMDSSQSEDVEEGGSIPAQEHAH